MSADVALVGLDGSNPLAFLAALGVLRSLSDEMPNRDVSLRWTRKEGAWRPAVRTDAQLNESEIVRVLSNAFALAGTGPFDFADELKVEPAMYAAFARNAMEQCAHSMRWTRFAAAFACETVTAKGLVRPTAFCFTAGQQRFLKIARLIVRETKPEHVHKSLFAPWRYDDPVEGLNLRWDPLDDRQWALRAVNPATDPSKQATGGMLGASRLALEGLSMFPTVPEGSRLGTTGFSSTGGNMHFSWPIWSPFLSASVTTSLLALRDIQTRTPDRRRLRSLGIEEVYRARRTMVADRYRNFSLAVPP